MSDAQPKAVDDHAAPTVTASEVAGAAQEASDVSARIAATLARVDALSTAPAVVDLETKWKQFQALFQQMNERLAATLQGMIPIESQIDAKDVPAHARWHGRLGSEKWPLPRCVVKTDALARPGYTEIDASEYEEHDETVLAMKVDVLVGMIRAAKHPSILAGAGTDASVIRDYASRAPNSLGVSQATRSKKLTVANMLALEPQYTHRAIATLINNDVFTFLLNQNHTGLLLKAGARADRICEIHGTVYDKTNRVVPMKGQLRPDLGRFMMENVRKTDCTLVLGSSLSGMRADGLASECARRNLFPSAPADATPQAKAAAAGSGLCIVNLQCTRLDHVAALRIFARIDTVLQMLLAKLGLADKIDRKTYPLPERGFEYVPADGCRIPDLRTQENFKSTGGAGAGEFMEGLVGTVAGAAAAAAAAPAPATSKAVAASAAPRDASSSRTRATSVPRAPAATSTLPKLPVGLTRPVQARGAPTVDGSASGESPSAPGTPAASVTAVRSPSRVAALRTPPRRESVPATAARSPSATAVKSPARAGVTSCAPLPRISPPSAARQSPSASTSVRAASSSRAAGRPPVSPPTAARQSPSAATSVRAASSSRAAGKPPVAPPHP
jgi:NAD-dependent SIR2 family protein deacetylase